VGICDTIRYTVRDIRHLIRHVIRQMISMGAHPILLVLLFSRMMSVYDSYPTCDPRIRHSHTPGIGQIKLALSFGLLTEARGEMH
jgi:hypothetical protein